jgi:putative colanic acid biosynthesis UDP-glucose lipid carrier transferase
MSTSTFRPHDMFLTPGSGRSVLQRRNSISNTLQPVLDGLAVLGVAYWLIDLHLGALDTAYTILLLLLMGALAVAYDHYAIYRSNVNFSRKVFTLFKAWTAAFAFLFILGFLTKQSENYSRLLVGQLFLAGFASQLLLHVLMRALQLSILKHSHTPDNALIIGTGRLANFCTRRFPPIRGWKQTWSAACKSRPGVCPHARRHGPGWQISTRARRHRRY